LFTTDELRLTKGEIGIMGRALDGIRVLDLTLWEAGPSCTETLAWLGAEVIKIEPPGGEQTRRGLSEDPDKDSWFFLLLNANKKAVTLNLKSERGRALFERLARDADVVVENLGPGAVERLGLGYERLRQINPRIVFTSVKGFGSSGPYAQFKSYEWIAQAMAGVMSQTGPADGPPMRVHAGLGDTASGIHAVVGILAALLQRHATGVGQRIEIAQQDVVVNLRRVYFSDYLRNGTPAPRSGNRSATSAPSGVYRCRPFGANDYVFLHANTPEMWRALTRVIGRPELADDPRYQTQASRVERVHEVDALVEGWTETRTKQEAMDLLAAAGVPCGAVLDSAEVMSNQHLIERGMIVDVEHPVRGKFRMPGNAIQMSGSETTVTRAPLLGEHNQEIFGKLAGLSPEELASLAADGVI